MRVAGRKDRSFYVGLNEPVVLVAKKRSEQRILFRIVHNISDGHRVSGGGDQSVGTSFLNAPQSSMAPNPSSCNSFTMVSASSMLGAVRISVI